MALPSIGLQKSAHRNLSAFNGSQRHTVSCQHRRHAPVAGIRSVLSGFCNQRKLGWCTRVADFSLEQTPTSTSQGNKVADRLKWKELSYSKQYDEVFNGTPLNTKQPIEKPSKQAQSLEPDSKRVLFSDVAATQKRPQLKDRTWNTTDRAYTAFILGMHGLALGAVFTFSWPMFWLFMGTYFVTGCLGITLSFHRQLSHRSFQTPKWLEYALAYCGVLAVQGDPTEWVSSHRYHHLHTDTPLDPHSPYEGFWWSHMGWLLDNEMTMQRVSHRSNAAEMEKDPFYKFIAKSYPWHIVGMFGALFALGGLPAVIWGGALRVCWVYHITWFVNSASHCWGWQDYKTGDLSRNNWWVSVLAFGEGWHNNHHAFEFSARHGLKWWQLDTTWFMISVLAKLKLVSHIKLPNEKQKARLAYESARIPS